MGIRVALGYGLQAAGYSERNGRRAWLTAGVLLLVLAAFALVRVVGRAWTCDDAFICYRYAKNLIEGRGLVFNAGERVEGYTNPLFTVGLAAAMALGAEPRIASMTAGALAYFAVAMLLAAWSRERTERGTWWIPFGTALWLVQDDLHTWATGGLETTVVAAFSLAGIRSFARTPASPRTLALGSTWLALACLTRPDAVVFAVVGVLGVFVMSRLSGSRGGDLAHRIAAAVVPLAVIGGAFAAFKLRYYGHLLPTTFYAKSAMDPYYAQGVVYVLSYGLKHWAMSLACVALPIAVVATGQARALVGRHDALLALAAFASFSTYVAHSGGDYMFARRLVPALPFLFVFLDAAVAALPAWGSVASALALVAASFFPRALFPDDLPAYFHGITDERAHYPEAIVDARQAQGLVAQQAFRGIDVKASFGGAMCMFAYYSDLPYLVESNGLTQYWAAMRPLKQRTNKIGHEKALSRDELREHGVTLIFHGALPPLSQPEPWFNEILFGRMLRVEMLVYDEAVLSQLARFPGVRFHRIDDTLREAGSDIRDMSCDDARASMDSLSHFYLDRHPDRAAPIREAVSAACKEGSGGIPGEKPAAR